MRKERLLSSAGAAPEAGSFSTPGTQELAGFIAKHKTPPTNSHSSGCCERWRLAAGCSHPGNRFRLIRGSNTAGINAPHHQSQTFCLYVAKSKKTPGVLEKSRSAMRKKPEDYFQRRKRSGKWVWFVFSRRR